MSKILVKAEVNYADEFNCEAIKIYNSLEEWEQYKSKINELLKTQSIVAYFGTNKFIEYEQGCTYGEWDFTVYEISDEIANFIRTNLRNFGTGYSAIFDLG